MVYTRPAHGDPGNDGSATDATVWAAAIATGLEAAETTITSHTASIALKANIASPTFTGTAAAPTPAVATDSTTLATTAFVGLRSRVTHPNTDDVLVQVWDVANARWQRAHYDSGWRDISSSQGANIASGNTRIRRLGNTVFLVTNGWVMGGSFTGADADSEGVIIPSGFVAETYFGATYQWASRNGSSGATFWWRLLNTRLRLIPNGPAAGNSLGAGFAVYTTADATPGSLPGTLLTSAPA